MTLDLRGDAERVAGVALAEDGPADITSDVTLPPGAAGRGVIVCRTAGVLAGTLYADAVARQCGCTCEWRASDGARMAVGETAATITGTIGAILRAERPLLNLLQRASGIATATRAYVDAVAGTGTRILHTRKTAPGLRLLDVSAVLAGGGDVHRLDLASAVMVKDNHWRGLSAGSRSLGDALAQARAAGAGTLHVEIESETQLRQACAAGASRLLIDNREPATVREWARLARQLAPGIEIEATGGITLATVRAFADAGADFVSVGALTHSVQAADISLELSD
ncbi:MAG TPA: carboxylating nicotinate-nucleotide diphosphorylase [Gemmatimonadales bacterium]|nr:carboxylating nicotinate-nucleotide diphosphorylase [Gemmatimonadales bacterium]